jgi:hypothetical protein
MDGFDQFLTFQFLATCLAINALMELVKYWVDLYKKTTHLLSTRWFQAFVLTPLNMVIGVGISLIPGWMPGAVSVTNNVILGICAGSLSLFLYTVFKKRVQSVAGVEQAALAEDPTPKPEDAGK